MTQNSSDGYKADIIAAIHKKGSSLAELSRLARVSSSTLASALLRVLIISWGCPHVAYEDITNIGENVIIGRVISKPFTRQY